MHTIAPIQAGATPLKASSAMEERGESGKIEKNTMLVGPQLRIMANAWGPCVPRSCRLSDSADVLKVPKAEANKKALNAEAIANISTIDFPFCGWRMHKTSTKISAGNIGKNPSKTEKTPRKRIVLGSVPWSKSAVSARLNKGRRMEGR